MGQATLCVVTLAKKSNIPADAVQNTFAFSTPAGGTAGEILSIRTALDTFYNDTTSSGFSLNHYLSLAMSTDANANSFEFYNLDGHLDGSPHGSPFDAAAWTLDAVSAGAVQAEVAICLTFHSNYGSDVEFGAGGLRPRARDRGRVYIGELGGVGESAGVTQDLVVSGTTVATIAAAAARLRDDVNTSWCVWSRADAALKPVTAGWVDNAFDIQRRRGVDATARTVW